MSLTEGNSQGMGEDAGRQLEINRIKEQADTLKQEARSLSAELELRNHELRAALSRLSALYQSTSWRITSPLRFVSRSLKMVPVLPRWLLRCMGNVGRAFFHRVPINTDQKAKIRSVLFKRLGFLFRHSRSYQYWAGRSNPLMDTVIPSATEDSQVNLVTILYDENTDEYEPMRYTPVSSSPIQLIAFFLPQYHPIPENDKWWGRGFTEWTNVSKARPQFVGHYQPQLPGELGFYDLRLVEVQERQIELAKHYGIHGFCYHHYWFGGKRLLERPLNQVLAHKRLDLPFCLCWANENWTRRWDGQEHEILMAQSHSPEDDIGFIKDIEPALRDERYIRIDGKPVLMVYRVNLLPDAAATAERWQEYCRKAGIGDLYLIVAQTFGITDPRPYGFDAAVEFPPHGFSAPEITDRMKIIRSDYLGYIYDYAWIVSKSRKLVIPPYKLFKTVMPSWDNSARRPANGNVFHGSSPALYAEWLSNAVQYTKENNAPSEKFVFINAWNEWAEGTHLEPDRRYGYAYLNATARVLEEQSKESHSHKKSKKGLVSVIMPVFNHERFIQQTLASIVAQTYKNIEIIIVDDGSTDRSVMMIQNFIDKNPEVAMRVIQQKNAGAHAAINHGVSEAHGEYVSIINSDDMYHPDRIRKLFDVLNNSQAVLAFSSIKIIDETGKPIGANSEYAQILRRKIRDIGNYRSVCYSLLDFNVTISTGNLFFKKVLFERIGGFLNLKYCHDWDFVLQSLKFGKPVFLDDDLYLYRLHSRNTFASLQNIAGRETEIVLSHFFNNLVQTAVPYEGFPSAGDNQQYFEDFIERRGYRRYLLDNTNETASIKSYPL